MSTNHYATKLTAILYADVAGYSRLTGQDEVGTHQRLGASLDEMSAAIQRRNGHVVHYAGDAVLAEFASVADALSCAVEVQRELEQRNADLTEENQVRFRIGINLGEVIVDRNDIYGDGVNVAARLESLAEPGGICVSDSVRTSIGTKLPLEYGNMGEQMVKNISEPVRAYRVRIPKDAVMPIGSVVSGPAAAGEASSGRFRWWASSVAVIVILLGGGGALLWWQPWGLQSAQTVLPLPDRPSVAVLPFDNFDEDSSQDYFSDGMTEDLITDLAKVSGLFVVSRNAVFRYKGQSINPQEVGRDLRVRHVLEGSIRKAGDRVRINAQLIDAQTGGHLWAERYDSDLKDIFALQDEITAKIVAALEVQLTNDDQARLVRRGTSSIEAYDLYLQARALRGGKSQLKNAEARRLLEQAIDLDPAFAQAYAELSWVYHVAWRSRWADPHQSQQGALASAQRAVELDDQLPAAHARLGWSLIWNEQYEEGMATAKRAIEIDPNYADGYLMLGHLLIYGGGSAEEAIELSKKGMELDPYNTYHYLMHIADGYWMLGKREEALAHMQRAVKLEPDFMPGQLWLAALLAELGQLEEARAALAEVRRLSPQLSIESQRRLLPYKDVAVRERFLSSLRKVGLPENVASTQETGPADDLKDSTADTITTQLSQQGLYRVSYISKLDPVPINQMHRWTVHLETPDGEPVENAHITATGGMPRHNHGLPSAPQVTQSSGAGDYLLEGMKFHMNGLWVITFDIDADKGKDSVTFNLVL